MFSLKHRFFHIIMMHALTYL